VLSNHILRRYSVREEIILLGQLLNAHLFVCLIRDVLATSDLHMHASQSTYM
jgi:hypothetical protein